jgi:hypothetical protein
MMQPQWKMKVCSRTKKGIHSVIFAYMQGEAPKEVQCLKQTFSERAQN